MDLVSTSAEEARGMALETIKRLEGVDDKKPGEDGIDDVCERLNDLENRYDESEVCLCTVWSICFPLRSVTHSYPSGEGERARRTDQRDGKGHRRREWYLQRDPAADAITCHGR